MQSSLQCFAEQAPHTFLCLPAGFFTSTFRYLLSLPANLAFFFPSMCSLSSRGEFFPHRFKQPRGRALGVALVPFSICDAEYRPVTWLQSTPLKLKKKKKKKHNPLFELQALLCASGPWKNPCHQTGWKVENTRKFPPTTTAQK